MCCGPRGQLCVPREARASSYAGKIGTGDEASSIQDVRELHALSPPSAARYTLDKAF